MPLALLGAAAAVGGGAPMAAVIVPRSSGPSSSSTASTAITATTWRAAGRSTSCRPTGSPPTRRRGSWRSAKLRSGLMPPAGGPRPDAQTVDCARAMARGRDRHGRRRAGAGPRLVAPPEPPRVRARGSRPRWRSKSIPRRCCPRTTSRATSTTTPTRCRYRPRSSPSTSTPRARSRSRPSAIRRRRRSRRTYGDPANMVISLPPDGAPGTGRQQHHFPGMPFGTRGGFVVKHDFPADGEYELTIGDMALAREVPRMEFENTVVVLLDGEELYRTNIGGEADHKAIDQRLDPAVEEINARLRKIPSRRPRASIELAVTFVQRSFAESDERTRTVALEGGQERIQAAHALRFAGRCRSPASAIRASRDKIFICRPTEAPRESRARRNRHEPRGARVPSSGHRRRPRRAHGVLRRGLWRGRLRGRRPRRAERGAREPALPVSRGFRRWRGLGHADDLELASRLSFFLWSSLPDDELLARRAGAPR